VELDEQTIETPFGRYRWLVMPFGISPAPEYFQQYLERNLEVLSGIKATADDIIIYEKGKTYEEVLPDHDNNVVKLLERCQVRKIKINEKNSVAQTEKSFVGHLLSDTGVKPDSSKVDAIMNMPRPTGTKAVQRF
jgi:hypothetical protein